MRTECSASEIDFGRAGGRRIVADFDGGMASTDAGALPLGETDKAMGLIARFFTCFRDERNPIYVVHEIETLVAQRVFGLALGCEDVFDHDELRRDLSARRYVYVWADGVYLQTRIARRPRRASLRTPYGAAGRMHVGSDRRHARGQGSS